MSTAAIQDVVEKVCSIPIDFRKRGDVSVVYLLEESGYDIVRDAITFSVIQQHLQAHPSLIDVWAGYSQDQRGGGWCFNDERCTTKYYSADAGWSREQVFSDRSQACADYIMRELEGIRASPWFGSGRKGLGPPRKKKRQPGA